jgi:hypothetical protein
MQIGEQPVRESHHYEDIRRPEYWVLARARFVNQRPKRLNLLEKSQVFPSDPLIDGLAGWPGILRPDNRDERSTKRRAAHPFGRIDPGRANGLTQQVLSANFC